MHPLIAGLKGKLIVSVQAFPNVPVICEGRIHTPEHAAAAMKLGAFAVIVGTAITHPTSVTGWFKAAVEN